MKNSKKLLAKYKKGNTTLEVFKKGDCLCARTSEVIDGNLQETSPLDEFDADTTIEELIDFYGMGGCEKVD